MSHAKINVAVHNFLACDRSGKLSSDRCVKGIRGDSLIDAVRVVAAKNYAVHLSIKENRFPRYITGFGEEIDYTSRHKDFLNLVSDPARNCGLLGCCYPAQLC